MNRLITEDIIPLFNLPVQLKDELEVKTFTSNMKNYSHLLIVEGKHYHINECTFNLIKAIRKGGDLENILKEYTILVGEEMSINDIIIGINELLAKRGIVETNEQIQNELKNKYLYFKVAIFSEQFLLPISNNLKIFFNSRFIKVAAPVLIILNYYFFFSVKIDQNYRLLLDSPLTSGLLIGLSGLSLFLHELGHISACSYFGARHGEIGGGIYIRYPVLYSNLSDAWRLNNKQRTIIDLGGVYFQLFFNLILLILYLITNELSFIITFKVISIQLLFTLNPFLRFDGYWVASDLLGIPNLRKRSSELFNYYFEKYILRKKELPIPYSLKIEKLQFRFLTGYSLISNLFFVCFVLFTILYFKDIIVPFKNEILILIDKIESIREPNIIITGISLFKIFSRIFAIFLVAFFLFRLSLVFINIIKVLYRLLNKVLFHN